MDQHETKYRIASTEHWIFGPRLLLKSARTPNVQLTQASLYHFMQQTNIELNNVSVPGDCFGVFIVVGARQLF